MTWPGPYPGSLGRLGSSESLAARGTESYEGLSGWARACVCGAGQGSCWQTSERAFLCLCVRGVSTSNPSFSYSYIFSMLVCVSEGCRALIKQLLGDAGDGLSCLTLEVAPHPRHTHPFCASPVPTVSRA